MKIIERVKTGKHLSESVRCCIKFNVLLRIETNIGSRIGRSEELNDFQRGTVIGCHLSDKPVCQISALLELAQSTVSAVIVKCKRLGVTTVQPRSDKPHKLTERDCLVLKHVARKNLLPAVATLTIEFQTAPGSNVSTRIVRQEFREIGFYGRAAAHKPKITIRNNKRRL
ncbi:uncharacterized protein LOC143245519 [Tachypleus tridentatus]|uniref:uncharacterized protein LOC143245519 n=1 Tax=Tachypleus tridentatus TaxID=6853 RepID=UPI003FCF8A43